VSDVTGSDEVGYRADCVLDRNRGVQPGRTININIVDPEASERIGDVVADRVRAVVQTLEAAAWSRRTPNFTLEIA
jgi:hypothetical protein